MNPPEKELEKRIVVWEAMHCLWLDTNVEGFYFDRAAKICAKTNYSIDELEKIFWAEVYPTMRYNLMPWDVAGEWLPVDSESLAEVILKRHKFGKRTWFKKQRKYAFSHWEVLSSEITTKRQNT